MDCSAVTKVVATLKEPRAGTPVFPLTQRSVILPDKMMAGREWIPIFRRVSDLVPESFRIVSLSVAWGCCLNTGFWVFFEVYTIKEQYFLSCILHSGDVCSCIALLLQPFCRPFRFMGLFFLCGQAFIFFSSFLPAHAAWSCRVNEWGLEVMLYLLLLSACGF